MRSSRTITNLNENGIVMTVSRVSVDRLAVKDSLIEKSAQYVFASILSYQ